MTQAPDRAKGALNARRPMVLDSAVATFLRARERAGEVSPHLMPVPEARVALARLQAMMPLAEPAALQEVRFDAGEYGWVVARIVLPTDAAEPLPIILYIHGGGWVMGDAVIYDRLIRALANGARAAVVFVNYTLAPEAHHPVQVEQAYAVLCGVVKECGALGLDASRIAIAGDCSGGAMASAVTMLAKVRRGPEIALQLLLYPIVEDPALIDASAAETIEGWLPRNALCGRANEAFRKDRQRLATTAFPLSAPLTDLNDLPEALIIVAEHDVARDGGEAYARRLAEAGVTTTCVRYNGTIHDFMLLNVLGGSTASRGATAQSIAALRSALHPK
ncbi:alpha/beta hydrolase [Sphingomonas arantia]|uniref:Alpha/beta hydrolase n=1 Tax=Sphingomonas arantia TaxID=1460676 RepID=A0ABW4TZV4_9SPHN